jgi:predicted nucleic acid-binding Zn ribbon protein
MYFFQQTASRHYFPVGEEQIAKQVWESAHSVALSKLEGNYCYGLRHRHYTANVYFVQFKTVRISMNHYTVTCRVASELCDCALSLHGSHPLVLTFTNTNSHGSHAQKCYNVFIFHYKNYFYCVHGHCVVTFRAIHPQECYCLIQCYSVVSYHPQTHTSLQFNVRKSYGILVNKPLRTKTTWKTWQMGR